MRHFSAALSVLLASASAFAGDTQAGTTVTWHASSEMTCETGNKKFP